MKTSTKLASLLLALAVAACGGSNFKGGGVALRKPTNLAVQIPGIDPVVDGGSKTIARGDNLDISIDAGGLKNLGSNTTTVLKPVDLLFVIDGSSSMKSVHSAVKNGANSLVTSLRGKGIDLWVGFVGFIDSTATIKEFSLTNNISGFQSYMNSIQPWDTNANYDFPEGGMYGIKVAASRLASQGRQGVLKTMVYVSDVVGHNGAATSQSEEGMTRDCTITAPTQAISQLVSGIGNRENFKFFYSVPPRTLTGSSNEGASHVCGGYVAETQMSGIMGSILPGVTYKGGELRRSNGTSAWPLSNSTLVESITPALSQTVVGADRQGVCVAQSAQLFDMSSNPSQPISVWQPSSLNESYQAFSTSNEVKLQSIFKDSYNLSLGNHILEMKVQRCCIDPEVAQSGNISSASCNAQSYVQTIRYSVNVR